MLYTLAGADDSLECIIKTLDLSYLFVFLTIELNIFEIVDSQFAYYAIFFEGIFLGHH
jgi:hypothetical protein